MSLSLPACSVDEHARDSIQSEFYADRCLKMQELNLTFPMWYGSLWELRFIGLVCSNK